jgi:hypothetical protein
LADEDEMKKERPDGHYTWYFTDVEDKKEQVGAERGANRRGK